MKIFYCGIMVLCFSKLFAQEVGWAQSGNWKLYDNRGLKGYDFTIEKLSVINSDNLNMDSIKNFLSVVSEINSNNTPVWMGYYIVTCQTKAAVTRVFYISTYAGFFYDPAEKKYYQIEKDKVREWLDYFADKEAAIQNKK